MTSVEQAIAKIQSGIHHIHNQQQLEGWASNEWFNSSLAQREFPNDIKGYVSAIVAAWKAAK